MDFKTLADTFEKIEATPSRLKMTDVLAGLFKKAKTDEISKIIYLLQGRVAPPFEPIEIGMGEKFVEEAISKSSGHSRTDVEGKYKDLGDLGDVAHYMAHRKHQTTLHSEKLTVDKVFKSFYKMATVGGAGSQTVKIRLLTELLNNASPKEARYVVRIPLGRLRLGIGDPTIIDAFSVKEKGDKSLREPIERAYNLCSDLGLVAKVLYTEGMKDIEKFRIVPGRPIRPALAERLPSGKKIVDKIGKCSVEAKYDGFRLQCHKDGALVRTFSRRQEDTTHMFPEIVAAVKKIKAKSLIIDGEALSFNEETGEYYPFQQTMQRKRKYGISKMAETHPLKLFVFDILYLDGKDLTQEKYAERRKVLEKIIKKGTLIPSERVETGDAKKLEKFFDDCVSRGLEGVIAKDPNAPYIAGARKFAWIKLKRSYRGELSDTIDLVIVGYYKGRGARVRFGFGGFLGCVYDDDADKFKTITKVGTGFTEEQMVKLRKELEKIKMKAKPSRVDSDLEPDVWVEPRYVVSITADEITQSPIHTAGRKKGTGYALRFPRMVSWFREDKSPEDATSVKEIVKMYKQQRHTKTQ